MQSLYGMLVPEDSQGHAGSAGRALGPGPRTMAPPPDKSFPSRDDLLNFLKSWAASQGYAVVIGRSRTNRLWIRCDRGGEYRDKHASDPTARQRKRKESRLTGCEFSIKASMRKDGVWRSRCEHPLHNHGPSEDLREHPSLRRMTDEQLQKVHELTVLGKSPAEIMEELMRLWPDIKVIRRDIYNARKNLKLGRDSFSDRGTSGSAPASAPASATTSFNASFDDPGRMSGATDSGRWAWYDEDNVATKKRKLGPSSRGSDTTATQSFNSSVGGDGPPQQMSFDASSNLPPASSASQDQTPQQQASWSRAPPATSSHRTGLMSPANSISYPTTTPDARTPTAASMRAHNKEFTGTATSHLSKNADSTGHGQGYYAQSMIPGGASSGYPVQPHSLLRATQSPLDGRSGNQSQIHPSLRSIQSTNPRTSPDINRRLSQPVSAGSHSNNILQPQNAMLPASSNARPPSRLQTSTGELPGSSVLPASAAPQPLQQQAPSLLQQRQVLGLPPPPSLTPLQQAQRLAQPSQIPQSSQPQAQSTQPQQPKPQSGAVLMQRIQRMEDELREQKSTLNLILSAVQDLKAEKNPNSEASKRDPGVG